MIEDPESEDALADYVWTSGNYTTGSGPKRRRAAPRPQAAVKGRRAAQSAQSESVEHFRRPRISPDLAPQDHPVRDLARELVRAEFEGEFSPDVAKELARQIAQLLERARNGALS